MKNLVLIILLFVSINLFSQEDKLDDATVDLYGQTNLIIFGNFTRNITNTENDFYIDDNPYDFNDYKNGFGFGAIFYLSISYDTQFGLYFDNIYYKKYLIDDGIEYNFERYHYKFGIIYSEQFKYDNKDFNYGLIISGINRVDIEIGKGSHLTVSYLDLGADFILGSKTKLIGSLELAYFLNIGTLSISNPYLNIGFNIGLAI